MGVGGRRRVRHQSGMRRCGHTLDIDDVLQCVGDTVERAAITSAGDFRLGRAGAGERAIGGDGDETVQDVVVAGDAVEAGLGQGHR